ncbi:type II toxin -antitoxin system TacA 1-like antitoxin [Streptomyces endophyticus]|uniref:DUF1778 domain-containing protein n=1 Tax=Streptomyces endophyticus TaxID=714166 RepID=A0ABU6F2F6_9ACTN|nr:DUF1778 domain-containing protein [Streptomyces endophyticus]MEB8338184.1 DUF1778 domain-containing protein [Streptomyces endophyticus]
MPNSSSPKKALNLRFPDPAQREAIETAARQQNMSLQEYILSAAYDRATAVERSYLSAFQASMAHSGAAFKDADDLDPSPDRRAAEQGARRELDAQQPEQGHAA